MLKIFRKNKKPQDFQKLFKPSPDFVRRTGFLFLSAFRQKSGRNLGTATPRAFRYFLRGLASGVAFMFIISSGAAYADQKNVGPDNLLYPLKRAQEVVNLTLSNDEEKPVLHLKLAERRLEEIEEVKQRDPSSEKLPGLSDDLRKELRNSIGALNGDEAPKHEVRKEGPQKDNMVGVPGSGGATVQKLDKSGDKKAEKKEEMEIEAPSGSAGGLATSVQDRASQRVLARRQVFTEKSGPSICTTFRTLITNQSIEAQQAIGENPELIEKFEKKCLPILREIQKEIQGDLRQGIQKVELENKNSSDD